MIVSLVRVRFPLEEGGSETMHALRREDGLFVLDNSPFYAFGISCGDVVRTTGEDRGVLDFAGVSERGGHSTYRVRMRAGDGHEQFIKRWREFEILGCTYEGSGVNERRLYSIDMPPFVPVQEAYSLLEKGEEDGVWDFEEGHYFEP